MPRRFAASGARWSSGPKPELKDEQYDYCWTGGNHGEPARLEPYLGMISHAALRRDDGYVFTHLHPAGSISMASQQVFQLRLFYQTHQARSVAKLFASRIQHHARFARSQRSRHFIYTAPNARPNAHARYHYSIHHSKKLSAV